MSKFLSGNVRLRVSRRLTIASLSILSGTTVIVGNSESHANASGSTATFFISAPGVEGPPSIPGLTIETFDTLGAGIKSNNTSLAIGTVSANSLTVHNCTVGPTCWAGAVTDTSTPFPSDFTLSASTPNANYPYQNKTPFAYPNTQVTIDLNRAVNYFGFYWAAGSGSNMVKLYSGTTLVASFSTADLNALIPTSRVASGATVAVNGGGTYNVDHYRGGHKSAWDNWYVAAGVNCRLDNSSAWSVACWNPQQFAYVHAVVPQGFTFDKVQLIASDFEFDNLAIGNYAGTFDPTGLVGIPLTNASTTPTLTPAPTPTSGTAPAPSDAPTATSAPSTSTIPVAMEVVAQKLPQTGNDWTLLLLFSLGMLSTGVALMARHRYLRVK